MFIDDLHPLWHVAPHLGREDVSAFKQSMRALGVPYCIRVFLLRAPEARDVEAFGLHPRLYDAAQLLVERDQRLTSALRYDYAHTWFQLSLVRAADILKRGYQRLHGAVQDYVHVVSRLPIDKAFIRRTTPADCMDSIEQAWLATGRNEY
jgi:hypothetical protein